ncbi:hypothetical protein NFI96_013290 [Prochilodus magdalenae]|nr:hypothetical protein NFI96_013290 [Prochilodus magdalenae]
MLQQLKLVLSCYKMDMEMDMDFLIEDLYTDPSKDDELATASEEQVLRSPDISMETDSTVEPHNSDSKVKRAASPVSSCLYMKRYRSMSEPPHVSTGRAICDSEVALGIRTEASSAPSSGSMKTYRSEPLHLHSDGEPSDLRTETQTAVSTASSSEKIEDRGEELSLPEVPTLSSQALPPETQKNQTVEAPVSSCVSASSNSLVEPDDSCSGGETSEPKEQEAASPASSNSLTELRNFSIKAVASEPNAQTETGNTSKEKLEVIFKEVEEKIMSQVMNELKSLKNLLSQDYQACSNMEGEEDKKDKNSIRKGVLKSTVHILQNMDQPDLANTLASTLAPSCHQILKLKLRDKYRRLNEGISTHGHSALNESYTELYITDSGSEEVSQEYEIKQIHAMNQAVFRKDTTEEKIIKCNDIFKPCIEQEKPIRTVLTHGITGIGKTVSLQKFILDWTEGKHNHDVIFIFPLPFRELNLLKNKMLSLINLLHCFFPETQKLIPRDYMRYKVIFIFDGLDECRLPLDFQNNKSLEDIEEPSSADVLLTNLIKGNLLPSALIWITSQPVAVSLIPSDCVDRVTEFRGFSDPQKQEYFRKRITDQSLASKMIKHVKSSRSLYIMCHIPVFCEIAATVLETILAEANSGEIPQNLTQVFTHFLIFQIKHKSQKHHQNETHPHQIRENILELGKLAFHQLEKGNLIYEEDLQECGISIKEAIAYSDICPQVFRQETGLHIGKVFSFVHLSIQQFLAALYTFLCFINKNYLKQQTAELSQRFSKSAMVDFLNRAVDRALQSENGHLNLFLRFLLGLSLESNQSLLQDLLTETGSISHSQEETVKYIKKKITQNASPDKSINLIHCLNELNDHSLVEEVQMFLQRRGNRHLHAASLSPAHWSALVFLLLNSEKELYEFNLSKYDPSEECLLRLFPVVKASKKALLALCNLGRISCDSLGSALQQPNSLLKELDLSNNDLQDSGVELLSAGLKSLHCRLEVLRLSGCMVTENGCSSLASALKSNPSHLKELDLTYNFPGESGVKTLSAALEDPHCRLSALRVDHSGEFRIKPGLRKYACELTLDPNSAHAHLSLSEGNRNVTCLEQKHLYPDHSDRFDGWEQVLCKESLTGRCYWEIEWNGTAEVAVTYKGIIRKGDSTDSVYGCNEKSWSLYCSSNSYCVLHKKKRTVIPAPASCSNRVGVYLDWPAGVLSFYSVSTDKHTLTHLHTFNTTFTEPLYAGFWVYLKSSVYLCDMSI